MADFHVPAASATVLRDVLHPRKVRIVFDRTVRSRRNKPAIWHVNGLAVAVLISLLLWGAIAALLAR